MSDDGKQLRYLLWRIARNSLEIAILRKQIAEREIREAAERYIALIQRQEGE